jgi:hypothetical protein
LLASLDAAATDVEQRTRVREERREMKDERESLPFQSFF